MQNDVVIERYNPQSKDGNICKHDKLKSPYFGIEIDSELVFITTRNYIY